MPYASKRNVANRPADRRLASRIPFKATSVISETYSPHVVIAQTTELSRFGCFVQTAKPHAKGTKVHVEIAEAGSTFIASGVVANITKDGMGIVFSMIEPESYEVLAKWLSRTPRRSDRCAFGATVEVRDLGSRNEQVAIIRDLSKLGCFVKTTSPLPKDSRILLRIEHSGAELTASARVTGNVSAKGMGVEFIEMSSENRAILEKWLAL